MALSDYAHHNEDALMVWWEEEGRHPYESDPYDDYDRACDFLEDDE